MKIETRGASEHNLKGIDVAIGDGLTVVTGVSGSGKSTLFIDRLGRALTHTVHTTSLDVKAEQHVFPAGYRRRAHSRFGCRTDTTPWRRWDSTRGVGAALPPGAAWNCFWHRKRCRRTRWATKWRGRSARSRPAATLPTLPATTWG